MEPGTLSIDELAERAGVASAEIERMGGLGILATSDEGVSFAPSDVQRVRLAKACEDAGLPLEGISEAIKAGRLSFAFLETSSYRRWAARTGRTYREVCEQTGVGFDTMRILLEAIGFAPMQPEDRIREDELEVVPLIQLALTSGIIDEAWFARVARVYADGLRRIANAETEIYHSRIEMPLLASGLDQRSIMEMASQMGEGFVPLMDRTLMAAYRRQQELAWVEDMVEHIEHELEASGLRPRPERAPAMCFLDLVGYTRLTEERGDAAAAQLAASLSVVADRSSREHGGLPVKWLGDGVMFHFREPAGAVASALQMVEEMPASGLPPAHVGVASGPVIAQGGDYFGRTVNIASRIAGRAGEGQVLVSQSVVEASPSGVQFVELGDVELKGITQPVRVFEALRA
jgi:adenylate cyclase